MEEELSKALVGATEKPEVLEEYLRRTFDRSTLAVALAVPNGILREDGSNVDQLVSPQGDDVPP